MIDVKYEVIIGDLYNEILDRESERDGLISACEGLLELVAELSPYEEDFIDRERLGLLNVELDAKIAIERAVNKSGRSAAHIFLKKQTEELYHTALEQRDEARKWAIEFRSRNKDKVKQLVLEEKHRRYLEDTLRKRSQRITELEATIAKWGERPCNMCPYFEKDWRERR